MGINEIITIMIKAVVMIAFIYSAVKFFIEIYFTEV